MFSGKVLGKDEKIFINLAKRKHIHLVLLNISKIDEKELEEKIKDCDLIYNGTAEEFAVEFKKTIEELGKKVIDSSQRFYYNEDKWIFFMKCKEYNIPTPDTILLSEDISAFKRELKEFGHWPVVLKRIYGSMGQFVDKAETLSQSIRIINRFWKRGTERLPIIAQEFIRSPSYRVLIIGDKIVQAVIKKNKGWKATGNYAKRFRRFEVDKNLQKIVKKIVKASQISVCGIDFLKKGDNWVVLEVNAEPDFSFFESEREKLINELLNFLKSKIDKN